MTTIFIKTTDQELIVGPPSYATGVTTDKLIAHKVLLDYYLSD